LPDPYHDAIALAAPLLGAARNVSDTDGSTAAMNGLTPMTTRMFKPPARCFQVGCVLFESLSGHQDHFRIAGRREGKWPRRLIADLAWLTAERSACPPNRAARRMRELLTVGGIE
jgi:hypothetical protein